MLLGRRLSHREPTPTLQARLQAALEEGLAESGGKGVAVTVLIPGEPPWSGVAGWSHGSVPITESSVFAAGSITKTFTAITLLRLAEEGVLSLDDSLHRWLPAYPDVNPDITLRQFLNHTGGLSDVTDPPNWLMDLLEDPDKVWDVEEYFLETIRPPLFEKGAGWASSTSGYLLLRMVIQHATGSTVPDLYHQYVTEPLGLNDTYVCPEDPLPSTLAHGWMDTTGDGIYEDFPRFSPVAFCSATGGRCTPPPGIWRPWGLPSCAMGRS
jgi:D-alanyl-D-alanine carboxypeptidase